MSKSKASCSASMVAATTGREVSGPSKTSSTSSPSDITTPASASSRAIRSRSSSVNCSRTSCRVPPSCMTIWATSSRSGEPKSISGSSSTSSDRVASATVLSGAYPCSRSAASRASPLSMPFRRLRSYESAMSAIASGPAPRRMSWATSNRPTLMPNSSIFLAMSSGVETVPASIPEDGASSARSGSDASVRAGVSVDDAAAVSGSSAMSAACSVRSAMAMTSSAVTWWFPSFVTMVTGSTSSSLSMFSRRRSRSCPAARSGRPPLVPPASRMSETCRAASSDSSSTVPSGMPCPPASDVKTIRGPWPVSCPGFVPAVPEVSAAVVSGVSVAVLKESHESGLSKMPSRRLLSSVSVASGPSWTIPSSSNQSSR